QTEATEHDKAEITMEAKKYADPAGNRFRMVVLHGNKHGWKTGGSFGVRACNGKACTELLGDGGIELKHSSLSHTGWQDRVELELDWSIGLIKQISHTQCSRIADVDCTLDGHRVWRGRKVLRAGRRD